MSRAARTSRRGQGRMHEAKIARALALLPYAGDDVAFARLPPRIESVLVQPRGVAAKGRPTAHDGDGRMRFAVAHKAATYLMVGFAYLAMIAGGGVSPMIALAGLVGLLGSWWWEPPNIRLRALGVDLDVASRVRARLQRPDGGRHRRLPRRRLRSS